MAIQFWDIPVQWRETFSVVTSFKTEIISSQSGKEQRRAMRHAARRVFSFKADALPKNIDRLYFLLSTALRNTVVMPEPTRFRRLASAMQEGDGSLSVDSPADWIKVGGYVALLENGNAEVHQVLSVAGNVIGLASSTRFSWSERARLSPAWKGLLSDSLSFQLPTNRVAQGSIDFSLLPGQELPDSVEPDIENTIYDRELFSFDANWADAPELSVTQSRDIVDYGRGAIALFTPVPFSARVYAFDVMNREPEAAYALTDFFSRMRGRQGEFFFAPPGSVALRLYDQVAEGTREVVVTGTLAASVFQTDPSFRYVVIKLDTGYSYHRKVMSATVEGSRTRLVLDLGVPEIISEKNVVGFSWVAVGRFESDDLTIDWQTTRVSTSRVAVRLLDGVPSEFASGLDEGTEWLLRYFGAGFVNKVILDPLDIVLNVKEPYFALVVDDGTQFLIDTYGRDPTDRWLLDLTFGVLYDKEPAFALVVDAGAQYLIDEYGRDPTDRWMLDMSIQVVNVKEPMFAEVAK